MSSQDLSTLLSPDSHVIDSHHLVFAYCGKRFETTINRDLHEKPVRYRNRFFRTRARNQRIYRVEQTDLLAYLEELSGQLERIIKRRSPYYWLFLYRRIKPVLSQRHDNLTDATTTRLVRHIAELAILKYGDLNRYELEDSKKIKFEEQWGGYLKLAVEDFFHDEADRKAFSSGRAIGTIPVDFRPEDYRHIYAIEGLAYEYWLCTARLRSTGKGARLWFNSRSEEFFYDGPQEIADAIKRYDERISGVSFFPTLIGIATPTRKEDLFFQICSVSYNAEEHDFSNVFQALGFDFDVVGGGTLTNFIPAFLHVEEFLKVHSYLDVSFTSRVGGGLKAFMYTLWALSNLALISNSASPDNYGILLFQLLRRGYSAYGISDIRSQITQRLLLHHNLSRADVEEIGLVTELILEQVTLTEKLRDKISLWSGGPHPILIPIKTGWIIDLVGIFEFISRMFTGVSDTGSIRGKIFEETVRHAIDEIRVNSNLEWGPREIRENGRLVDEIDAMIRKGNTVYVCECFSMWRPLNFEIGHPATIEARTTQINEKIAQAFDTCSYLKVHPIGRNYDYHDVLEFVPLVVSPFIEWLPNASNHYWLSAKRPRVMALDELINFLSDAS
jgi:hypothetical protein